MINHSTNGDLLTKKRKDILTFIDKTQRSRGYPPSVREIGEACQLASPSSVQFHLKVLQEQGFLMRDPSKPRALTINLPGHQELGITGDVVSVPLLGDVAAGVGTLATETFTGDSIAVPRHVGSQGTLFALRVKGDSMIEDGIFERDIIVARKQSTANTGEIVVAGIYEQSEATIKRVEFDYQNDTVILNPSNSNYSPMIFNSRDVEIYGKVVFLQREF